MSLLAVLLALGAQAPSSAELAAEFELRAAVAAGARPGAGLAARDWRVRCWALETIERAARAGFARAPEDEATLRAALEDPHPSVRARAWRALAARGDGAVTEERVLAGVREELGSVRLSVARALAEVRGPGRAAATLTLAFDGDERVRRAARGALAGFPDDEAGRPEALAALLARLAEEEDEPAFAGVCLALLVGEVEPRELASVRAAARDEGRAALAEALAFAAGFPGDAEVLARGLARQRDDDWDPLRARLFASAGQARSEPLARALFAPLASLVSDEQELAREACLTLLVASLPRATAFAWLERNVSEESLLAELVPPLANELEALAPDSAVGWLAAGSPALRGAVLGAAAAVFTRVGEAGSETLLVQALERPEPELAARAFELLAGATRLASASESALLAAWRRRDAAGRIEALASFTRERPFPAFRDEWLTLGDERPDARGALGELLGALRADGAAAEGVRRWLAQDLARVAWTETPARELEQRVQSEVRALLRLAPESVTDFGRALDVALGRSTEIGKLAVAGLGRSEAGRTELARRLAQGALASEADRRTRIEAGIQLAEAWRGPARAPAVALLLAEREQAALDLRERLLAALAVGAEAEPLAALADLMRAPATESIERTLLVALLARHAGERVADDFLALVEGAYDLEARRAALGAFAEWPGAADRLGDWLLGARAKAPQGAEEALLVLGEARVALAAAAPEHAALEGWLEGPLVRAESELAARLAGRELSAVGFTWRAELEVARHLARARRLAAALPSASERVRLDGRLLDELARSCAETEPELARELTRSALLARLGERDPARRELLALEARLCVFAGRAGDAEELRVRLVRLAAARRVGELFESDWSALARALFLGEADPEGALRRRVAGLGPASTGR